MSSMVTVELRCDWTELDGNVCGAVGEFQHRHSFDDAESSAWRKGWGRVNRIGHPRTYCPAHARLFALNDGWQTQATNRRDDLPEQLPPPSEAHHRGPRWWKKVTA